MSHDAMELLRRVYGAAGALCGDPEDCEDCFDINERPCRIHGEEAVAFYHLMQEAAELLGPCVCGHHCSEHYDLDTTCCKACSCGAFRLLKIDEAH